MRDVPQSPPGINGLKRHAALVPLSRDHHSALVQARALRRTPDAETARAFLAYFDEELCGHMQDEERIVLPAAKAAGVDGVERILAEHRELAALVDAIRSGLRAHGTASDPMCAAGQLIDDHVRYEERAFFEEVQKKLTREALQVLGRALDAERTARGAPGCAVNLSASLRAPLSIRSASPSRSRRRP
jgi:hypothetical protein